MCYEGAMQSTLLQELAFLPEDWVLIPGHLLNECLCLFFPPIHDQSQAHGNATDDL